MYINRCRKLYAQLRKLYAQPILKRYRLNTHSRLVPELIWRAVDDFLKFIAIKTVYGNNLGTDFSPRFAVDSIWHHVILDTQLYDQIQRTCRRRIHHHPLRRLDSEQTKRLRRLLTLYLSRRVIDGQTIRQLVGYQPLNSHEVYHGWNTAEGEAFSLFVKQLHPAEYTGDIGLDTSGDELGC